MEVYCALISICTAAGFAVTIPGEVLVVESEFNAVICKIWSPLVKVKKDTIGQGNIVTNNIVVIDTGFSVHIVYIVSTYRPAANMLIFKVDIHQQLIWHI